MLTIIVRFTRGISADIDYARENFPHLEFDPELQLLEQFKKELYERETLRGFWRTLDARCVQGKAKPWTAPGNIEPEHTQYVWVEFTGWQKDLETFVRELQNCYDRDGMNGEWNIIEACNDYTVYTIKQIQEACKVIHE